MQYDKNPNHHTARFEEETLSEMTINVERKAFHVSRRKNQRGEFYRIVEESTAGTRSGKLNQIIVPLDGMDAFMAALYAVKK